MKRFSSILLLAGCLLCLLSASRAFAQTNEILSCGDNSSGQIGNNSTANSTLITPAFSISGIKAIACGYNHTLALDSYGTVWAWGDNGLGQLGTGDTIPHSTPIAVFFGARAIAAGAAHSLALDASGTVWAWGDNANGELGTASGTNPLVPNPMVGMPLAIKAIACGGLHSLMLDQGGNLYGCGYNGFGQLAQADNNDRYTPTWMGGAVEAMAAGYAHTLVLINGGVFAAGLNDHGELGNGTLTNGNSWVSFPNNTRIRSIGAGHFHSLAVAVDGSVYAWGYNANGQLGMGDTTDRLTPAQMPGAANVKAVTGGEQHTLVLTAGGKALATGYNAYGQLGDGTRTSHSVLSPIKNAAFIRSIAAGSFYSVLFKPFTLSLATGYNNYGQLGIGGIRYVPQINTPRPMAIGNNIVAVSAGPSGWNSLLLRADGTVWACGRNDFGQLGQGTAGNGSTVPVQVLGPGGSGHLENIIAISAGNFHSMALAADGSVYTWGRNSHGQLGTGDFNDYYAPVQVMGSNSAIDIAAGGYHSMVIKTDDSLCACGMNTYEQLGLGQNNFTDQSSFTNGGFAVYSSGLVVGNFHSVFLDYTGALLPFGLDSNGQLGDGNNANQDYPEYESGTQVIGAAAGALHTLVLNAAGQVYGAGYNGDGELGLGNNSDQWYWTFNPYIQATGIACGYDHSLYVNVYGELFASGYGYYGQLGNGSISSQAFPIYVPGAPYTTSMAGGWGHTVILTAPPILMASVKVSPKSVVGGANVTGTVTLNGLAGAGGQTVYLAADNSVVNLPRSVNVASTSKSASFTIHTSHVSSRTVVNISAYVPFANGTASSANTTLTLNP